MALYYATAFHSCLHPVRVTLGGELGCGSLSQCGNLALNGQEIPMAGPLRQGVLHRTEELSDDVLAVTEGTF
jgi:hypothetical protein